MYRSSVEILCTADVWLKVSRPLTMKKEGIQTRNRKSSSKSVANKSASDDDSSAWSMLERIPQQPVPPSSRSQHPHQFKTYISSPASSSDVHRPSLSNYFFDAAALGVEVPPPPYPDDTGAADAAYPVAYAHAQQVPGDYASSVAAFGGASGFSVATAGYCL